MYYFFARRFDGFWEYLYKLYSTDQINHATQIYLNMKAGRLHQTPEGKWEPDGPNIWQEVTFVNFLPDVPRDEKGYYGDPERAGINLKLNELNKDISGWKPV